MGLQGGNNKSQGHRRHSATMHTVSVALLEDAGSILMRLGDLVYKSPSH